MAPSYTRPSDADFVAALAADYKNEIFFIDLNEFNSLKEAITESSANQFTVGITIGRAIIVGRTKPGIKGFAKKKKVELKALLSRVKAGTLTERDSQFLSEA